MEKFTPSEICADIKIYDYKKKVKYDEKSLMILKETGQVIKAEKSVKPWRPLFWLIVFISPRWYWGR